MQGTWELGGQCEPRGHDDACTVCTALHKSRALGQGTALALALENTGKAPRGPWRALGGTARLLDSTGKALREPGRATSPAQMGALRRGIGALLHLTKPRSRRPQRLQVTPKRRPRAPKNRPRAVQERPRAFQECPRAIQDVPKSQPRAAYEVPQDIARTHSCLQITSQILRGRR